MKPPARIGLLGWLLLAVGLLGLAVVAGWWWFVGDGDLRRLLAEPGNPPPVAVELQPPAVRGDPIQPAEDPFFAALAAAARSANVRNADGRLSVEYWDALHAGITRAAQAGAGRPGGTGADAVRLRRVVLGSSVRTADSQRLVTDLAGRIATLPDLSALSGPVADSTALLALGTPRSLDDQQNVLLGVKVLVAALTARLPDLRPRPRTATDDPLPDPAGTRASILASLRALRGTLWRERASVAAGDFALLLAWYQGRVGHRPAVITWNHAVYRVAQRWYRAADLRAERARWAAATGAGTPAELLARVRAVPPADRPGWLAGLTGRGWRPGGGWERVLLNQLLVIDVLCNELASATAEVTPLEDPFDPLHGPLHPQLRDGVRVGWYSVGPDSSDDGGDMQRDIVLPVVREAGWNSKVWLMK